MCIHAITMPKWGVEMQSGVIVAWHVSAGARVVAGESLADIETDKIVNAVEAPADGILRRIVGAAGQSFSVGELIGVVAAADVSDAELDGFISSFVRAGASSKID